MLEWDGLVSNWFYCANCYYYLSTIVPVWNHIFKLSDIKLPMLGNHLIRLSAGVVILSREFMYTRTGRKHNLEPCLVLAKSTLVVVCKIQKL
jgi:hypothetical protein